MATVDYDDTRVAISDFFMIYAELGREQVRLPAGEKTKQMRRDDAEQDGMENTLFNGTTTKKNSQAAACS
jgi:hypothetical protein